MLTRRTFLMTSTLAMGARAFATSASRLQTLPAALAQIEAQNHCRLGVAVLDTLTGETAGHRADERFTMCSSFKFLLVADILQRIDQKKEALASQLPIPPKPLLSHSPLTEPHAGRTMSIQDLCAAALTQSDNTAANLLLAHIGGPAAYTSFCRSLGDQVTRLDRTEPDLNLSAPNDPRDTASPNATVANLRTALLGRTLTPSSRTQLTRWIVETQTGLHRLRAGLPQSWRGGDRTGSNGESISNDIAILYPPNNRPPLLVAAYLTECPGPEDKREAILAHIGSLIAASV